MTTWIGQEGLIQWSLLSSLKLHFFGLAEVSFQSLSGHALAKAHRVQYSTVNYSSWSMTPGWLDMLKFDFTLLLCSSQDGICTAPSFVISCAALCSNQAEWNLKEWTNIGLEWILYVGTYLFSLPHNLIIVKINVKTGSHQTNFRQLSISHDM